MGSFNGFPAVLRGSLWGPSTPTRQCFTRYLCFDGHPNSPEYFCVLFTERERDLFLSPANKTLRKLTGKKKKNFKSQELTSLGIEWWRFFPFFFLFFFESEERGNIEFWQGVRISSKVDIHAVKYYEFYKYTTGRKRWGLPKYYQDKACWLKKHHFYWMCHNHI